MKVGGSTALNPVKSSDAYFRATIPENQKNSTIMLKHIFFSSRCVSGQVYSLIQDNTAIWLSQSKF